MEKEKECLECLETVLRYIDDEFVNCRETEMKDINGFGFKTDVGYFFEGLDGLKKYLTERIAKEHGG